jgi:hypothetical protein
VSGFRARCLSRAHGIEGCSHLGQFCFGPDIPPRFGMKEVTVQRPVPESRSSNLPRAPIPGSARRLPSSDLFHPIGTVSCQRITEGSSETWPMPGGGERRRGQAARERPWDWRASDEALSSAGIGCRDGERGVTRGIGREGPIPRVTAARQWRGAPASPPGSYTSSTAR